MGEFASYRGSDIKIGTCESMYYLRADQARLVTPRRGSVDPIAQAEHIRFRFPFPFEDGIEPGAFEDYSKRLAIHGLKPPATIKDEHYSVQFVAQSPGYNVSLPCPESFDYDDHGSRTNVNGLWVHRNGFSGAVGLIQQRLLGGQLLPILSCACGVAWRVPEEDAAPLFDAIDAEITAMRHRETISSRHYDGTELPDDWRCFWHDIADRIRQGYDRDYVAALGFVAVAA